MRQSAGLAQRAAAAPRGLPARGLAQQQQQQQQQRRSALSPPAARRRAFVESEASASPSAPSSSAASSLLLFKQLLASSSSSSSATPFAASVLAAAAAAAAATGLASPPAASAAAAEAAATLGASNPFEGVQANSLYVTLALFLMSVPGIWSQVKRAPKSKIKRITFEVAGPKSVASPPVALDDHARAVFRYFKRYNYEVVSTGEVITFSGVYAADRGQAAAVTLYTFFGLGSVALVLATLFPDVGATWYGLTALSPLAAVYYFRNGERREEVRVKMVASDDEATADVVVEGDADEIERLSRELGFTEKGKVRVRGLLEAQEQRA
jgi:hypothetical protein